MNAATIQIYEYIAEQLADVDVADVPTNRISVFERLRTRNIRLFIGRADINREESTHEFETRTLTLQVKATASARDAEAVQRQLGILSMEVEGRVIGSALGEHTVNGGRIDVQWDSDEYRYTDEDRNYTGEIDITFLIDYAIRPGEPGTLI